MEGKARSIRLPLAIWEALERDAHRCKRSDNRQMEAILWEYYHLGNVELSDLEPTRKTISPHLEMVRERTEEAMNAKEQNGKRKSK